MEQVKWKRFRGLPLLLVGGALGALRAMVAEPPLAHDARVLAEALSDKSGGKVLQSDVRWEPSLGLIHDAWLGRRILFLAADSKTGFRDVFRARVRLSAEGIPLAISNLHNLTRTPLDDDQALVLEGDRAAFVTSVYGAVSSAALLELRGEGTHNKAEGFLSRSMAAVTNWQKVGSFSGIARTDLSWDEPRETAMPTLSQGVLTVALEGKGGRKELSYDATTERASPGLHVEPALHLPKRLSHWAVDTARSWIGPEPIVWLEDKVFGMRDDVRRFTYRMKKGEEQAAFATALPEALSHKPGAEVFPPDPIPSPWKNPEVGEGKWDVGVESWVRHREGEGPAPFFKTFVRPDEDRPYAKVLLVAMDMRQLELRMEAGVEDPEPLTGPHGPGRVPRDPAVLSRLVAAFNGAFKTEHGHYGMMVKKRVLLPPQPAAATVVTLADGRIAMGTWGAAKSGLRGIAEANIESFRQNLEPLVDKGEVNPTGRTLWGYTLPGKGMQTERSGICVSRTGILYYAWGDDTSATTLGKAMKMAGCEVGMHLDMNPYHTGFVFTNVEDIEKKKYRAELLTKKMGISPDRFLVHSPKDFFYLLLRDVGPESVEGVSWHKAEGAQPTPAFLPSIWRAEVDVSEGTVELHSLDGSRLAFVLRAGSKDTTALRGEKGKLEELSPSDKEQALFAFTLGGPKDKRGLRVGGRVLSPFRQDESLTTLSVLDGKLSFDGDAEDSVALPTLLLQGKQVPEPLPRGHFALAIVKSGRVLLAKGPSSRALAQALLRVGADRAVVLSRDGGEGERAFHHAGTGAPPRGRYEETVIYALSKPEEPRAFRFEPEVAAPAKHK